MRLNRSERSALVSISRHTTYNLAGALLPVAITLVTVPLYLAVVGAERYGALAIAWVLLGYLGFLDLGLGAAVSQRIAAHPDGDGPRRFFWTGLWTSLAMSLLAAAVFYVGAAIYFSVAPPGTAMMQEFQAAVPWIGMILPVAMLSGVTGGALHGRQRFLAMNVINATSSTLMSLLPLLVAFLWWPTLSGLIAGAIAARAVGLLLQLWTCTRAIPLRGVERPRRELLKPLLSFGGWITVSTAVSPLLQSMDRLAIGAFLGTAAVAAYSIAYSLVARMAIIPASLSSALFPRFAVDADGERERIVGLALAATAAVMTPAVIGALLLIQPFFILWLGPEMARASVPVAYALVAGAWTNSIAYVPATLLQGSGRPDLVAKTHLVEILPYWMVLGGSLYLFGLVGAAAAWSARASADCLLLCWRSGLRRAHLRPLLIPLALLGLSLAALALDNMTRLLSTSILFMSSCVWMMVHLPASARQRFAAWGIGRPRAASPR